MIGDILLQQANNPGTGTFSLIAAPAGRGAFVAQLGTGQLAYYFANDGTSWEVGYGTLTAGSPDTLSRDTVLRNSLGTTAKINFTGLVTLTSDVPSARTLWASADNTSFLAQSRRIYGLGAATQPSDATRLDQVVWRDLGSFGLTSGAIYVPLPSGYTAFRIGARSLVPTAETFLYARLSLDGGATYKAGSTDYVFQAEALANLVLSTSFNQTSYFQITGNTLTTFGAKCSLEIDTLSNVLDGQSVWYSDSAGSSNPGLSMGRFAGYLNFSGTPNYLIVGAGSAALSGGNCRLEGRV